MKLLTFEEDHSGAPTEVNWTLAGGYAVFTLVQKRGEPNSNLAAHAVKYPKTMQQSRTLSRSNLSQAADRSSKTNSAKFSESNDIRLSDKALSMACAHLFTYLSVGLTCLSVRWLA